MMLRSFKSIMPCSLLGWMLLLAWENTGTLAQEEPKYTLPNLFDWVSNDMEDVRQNFCGQYAQVAAFNLSRKDALRGMNITVALFDYQLENGTHIPETDPGAAIMFMDEIASRAGFSWRNQYARISAPTANRSWNDVLLWTLNTYDVMGEWYTRSIPRLASGIVFPESWYDGSLIMIRNKPIVEEDVEFDTWAFMNPFTREVWWLLGGMVIATALVFHLIMTLEETGISLWDSIFITSFSLTGHYHYNPLGIGSRISAVSFCLVALIMVAIYTANLASFLIVKNEVTTEPTVSTLPDAIRYGKTLCTLGGSASQTYLEQEYNGTELVLSSTYVDDFINLDNGSCDIALLSRDTWEALKDRNEVNVGCRKEWIGRTVVPAESGFSLLDEHSLCNSLLRDVLDLYLVEFKVDGTYNRIWEQVRARTNNQDCEAFEKMEAEEATENNNNDETPLDVKNVGGIFIIHSVILCFAVLVSICERRVNKYQTQQDELAESANSNKTGLSPEQEEATTERNEIPPLSPTSPHASKRQDLSYQAAVQTHPLYYLRRRNHRRLPRDFSGLIYDQKEQEQIDTTRLEATLMQRMDDFEDRMMEKVAELSLRGLGDGTSTTATDLSSRIGNQSRPSLPSLEDSKRK